MSNRSDTLDQLATALSLAQAEFTKIPKDSTNPFFKSKYAGLAAVVEKASPVLTKHGLAVSQFIGADEEGHDTLTTWLLHKSGQFLSESMRLHLSKVDAQGQGSATTYARRYSYMAVLGLVADEDDDGEAARRRAEEEARKRAGRNGECRQQPSAAPAQATERVATAKQRSLIFARASEHNMPASILANIVLVSCEAPPREFDSEEAAQEWLKRGLDRLPASKVDLVLKNVLAEVAP